jgi:hypothetical protein
MTLLSSQQMATFACLQSACRLSYTNSKHKPNHALFRTALKLAAGKGERLETDKSEAT